MKTIRELLQSIRVLHDAQPAHKKVLRHVEHGFHSAYLGWYVIEWHTPVSIFCAVLFLFAVGSWVAPWLGLGEVE